MQQSYHSNATTNLHTLRHIQNSTESNVYLWSIQGFRADGLQVERVDGTIKNNTIELGASHFVVGLVWNSENLLSSSSVFP